MSDITWTNITVKIGDLKPWADNPRYSTKAQAARLEASYHKWGQVITIAVDKELNVLDGHQRLSVWLTLYGKDYLVDARQASVTMSEENRKELVITLHAGAVGNWDWERMANWEADKMISWGMDKQLLNEWSKDAGALATMLQSEKSHDEPESQTIEASELNKKWGVVTGDLFRIGDHYLLCGDSTNKDDVARVVKSDRVLVVTDPPYGIDIVKNNTLGHFNAVPAGYYAPVSGDNTTETAERFYKTCLEMGIQDFVIWGGNYFSTFLPPKACWIVWDKRGDIPSNIYADCELAWTSKDTPAKLYKQLWMGMIREGEHDKRIHPTQKPIGVMEFCINLFDNPIIYDGFLGSGSTMVACQYLHRLCSGIEKEPDYCAVILQRMSDTFPGIYIEQILHKEADNG